MLDMERLDDLLRLSLPTISDDAMITGKEAKQRAKDCAELAIAHLRAHVLNELDKLAREFEAAGRPNTVRAIRETAARIAAALQEASAPGTFQGPR
jgi:hypothetical protein